MQRELFKELWILRFRKMLRLEQESVVAYEELLEECEKKHKSEKEIQQHFKTLIQDEKKHAKLVQELIKIVECQED